MKPYCKELAKFLYVKKTCLYLVINRAMMLKNTVKTKLFMLLIQLCKLIALKQLSYA